MKRYTAILCAVLLTGSLCACGKANVPADTTTTTTTTAPVTTSTTTDMTVPDKTPLNLTYASPFSDGVAFVRYPDADGVEHTFAINPAGDTLFEVPVDVPVDGIGFQNGIWIVGNVIYDKTGAVIASPEKSGYTALLTGNCGGYVLAKREVPIVPTTTTATDSEGEDTTTTASTTTTVTTTMTTTTAATTTTTTETTLGIGTTVSTESTTTATTTTTEAPPAPTYTLEVGVLNNKGEWVHPLSADHPVAVAFHSATLPAEKLTTVADGVVMVYMDAAGVPKYYHFESNVITPDYVHYTSANFQDEDAGIYQQAADGTEKRIIENVVSDYFLKTAFIGKAITVSEEERPIVGTPKLYDYTGKALMDLADYPLEGNTAYYVKEHLILPTLTEEGASLLVVLNKEGKTAFDPITLDMRDKLFAPDDTGFVIAHATEGGVSYRHYSYSGTVTEYTNVATFNGFSEGLAAVTLVDGQICYINAKEEIVIR